MNHLAPIIIFAYKRLDTLQQTINSLKKCDLAMESEIIIFSDAAIGENDFEQVASVRKYLQQLNGFKSIQLHISEKHKELANSIIDGVTNVIDQYGKVIVLEDDLIVTKNFLVYMNQALDKYKNIKKVFSISGYNIPVKIPHNYKFDVYFTPRASSWGWATWKDRWVSIDWQVKDYSEFRKNKQQIVGLNQGGSDLSGMLESQMKSKIDSWAIRWCYHQFKIKSLTVYPTISKIQNIGFSNQATHSNVYNRYKTPLDVGSKNDFIFSDDVKLDPYFLHQFQKFFSVKTRIYNQLKTFFYKAGFLQNSNA